MIFEESLVCAASSITTAVHALLHCVEGTQTGSPASDKHADARKFCISGRLLAGTALLDTGMARDHPAHLLSGR